MKTYSISHGEKFCQHVERKQNLLCIREGGEEKEKKKQIS